MFNQSFWKNKRVMVTGHSGFKGSWLTFWLQKLGCKVLGISNNVPFSDGIYELGELSGALSNSDFGLPEFINVLDKPKLDEISQNFKPEIIFHLAAQPLVFQSYANPVETFNTNLIGTVNVLESVKKSNDLLAIVSVTSDKVYKIGEITRHFSEDDCLGGRDPYSASKACSDLATEAYYHSYFSKMDVGVAVARSGNVIGGGDWSKDRLIPDIFRSWQQRKTLNLRNPLAVRPWQHVIEVIYGYLLLAERLVENPKKFSRPYNFGPLTPKNYSVHKVVDLFAHSLENNLNIEVAAPKQLDETHSLIIDTRFVRETLGWEARWSLEEIVEYTTTWYQTFYRSGNVIDLCDYQISEYTQVITK